MAQMSKIRVRGVLLSIVAVVVSALLTGCGGELLPLYGVSGRVTIVGSDVGLEGVELSFSGFGTARTAADGTFQKSGLSGSVTITPIKPGWSFDPPYRQVTGNTSGLSFIAQPSAAGFGKILYVSDSAGNEEIYCIDQNGLNTQRITYTSTVDEECPVWSPDRTKIAYDCISGGDGDVFVMAADGSNPHNLTGNSPHFDGYPTWSPDGTKIAFVSDRDGDPDIYVMDVDGSNQHPITWNPYIDSMPTWSPDGTKIAFVSTRDNSYGEIYTIDTSDYNIRRLTYNNVVDADPDWSPDGQTIVFSSAIAPGLDGLGAFEICSIDAGGYNFRRLTNNDCPDLDPCYSPYGDAIVFTSVPPSFPPSWELIIMDPDGSNAVRLLTLPYTDEYYPEWLRVD